MNEPPKTQDSQVLDILAQAKLLAQRYRTLTGKPLGITGEVAEYEAARILGVSSRRRDRRDMTRSRRSTGSSGRLQIKGRCIPNRSKPGQRIGSIDINKEWDATLLVLVDENFDAYEIYEAERAGDRSSHRARIEGKE